MQLATPATDHPRSPLTKPRASAALLGGCLRLISLGLSHCHSYRQQPEGLQIQQLMAFAARALRFILAMQLRPCIVEELQRCSVARLARPSHGC